MADDKKQTTGYTVEGLEGTEPKIDLKSIPTAARPLESITIAEPEDSFTPIRSNPGSSTNPQTPMRMFPQGPSSGPLTPENISGVLNTLRPYISGTAGTFTATMGGPFSPITGPLGYAATDLAMKSLDPQQSENFNEAMTDSAKEALINEIGGRIFQSIGGGVKAVRNAGMPEIYKLYPTTSQALTHYGYNNLATAAKFVEDFGAPAAKAKALDQAGGAGFTQALLLSNRMNSSGRFTRNIFQDPQALHKKILDTLDQGITKNPTPGQFQSATHYASKEARDLLDGSITSPFEALDNVMTDTNKLDKVLLVGQAVGPKNLNVRKDLQSYYWNRIFQDATEFSAPGKARIDPEKINQLWFNPKSGSLAKNLETLYGRQTKENLDEFMKNILTTQDKQMSMPWLHGKLKYLPGGFLAIGLAGEVLGSHMLSSLGAGVAGLYIPVAAMGRILTTPGVSRFMAAARGAEPLSGAGKFGARMIFNALEGSRVAMMNSDGKKTWGGIVRQPDGSFKFTEER